MEIKPKDFIVHRSDTVGNEDSEDILKVKAQATLKGSVGGVQSILSIQEKVSTGITQYDAGVKMLEEIFGFDNETAKAVLGLPIDQKPTEKTIEEGE